MNKQKMLEIANLLDSVSPNNFHMSTWFGSLIPAYQHDSYEEFADYVGFEELVPVTLAFNNTKGKAFDLSQDVVDISCNTTACIAGWVVVNEMRLAKNKISSDSMLDELDNDPSDIQEFAKHVLDLTYHQCHNLFYCNDTSIWGRVYDEYEFDYDSNIPETWKIHPKHAADVLRRISNGELMLCSCNDCLENKE